MKNKIIPQFILLLFTLIFMPGLAEAKSQKVTVQQAQVMQTKNLEANYKRVFKALMSVLQDNNFIIMSSNYDAGLIHAQTGSQPGFGINKKVVLTANLDEISKAMTKVRINMMAIDTSSTIFLLGGSSQSESGKPLQKPEVYQRLFSALEKEVFVRTELAK